MPSPPISIYLTTIASQPALRQKQEYILRILQVKKISFTSYDLASDENAKRLWRRRAPADKQQLPGILIGGQFPGTFADFEDAVESSTLDQFLRLNESYNEEYDDRLAPPAQPVGVPGAVAPLEMTPEHLKAKILAQPPSPLQEKDKQIPVNKRVGELDMTDELPGYGLQGVKVMEDELKDLVAELGLSDDDAVDLVKGLSFDTSLKEAPQRKPSTDAESGTEEKPVDHVIPKVEEKAAVVDNDTTIPSDPQQNEKDMQ